MASYHLNVKTIQRSQGRSSTAAAAYRAGERITCDRYGVEHDYTRKSGVEYTEILTPADAPDWASDRSDLWNAVEVSETRKNSVVAREWEVALPHNLSDDERRELALGFAQGLVDRYGVVADVAIHSPHREGDQRNHHAHILTSTRRIGPEGFGEKTRELDVKQTSSREVTAMRESWAGMQNEALERAGTGETVDHRSLETQREEAEREARDAEERGEAEKALRAQLEVEALSRDPEPKLGPRTSAMERRAQREAEAEGVAYTPVTDRGAEVIARRAERSMFEEARERLDTARDRYDLAREEGAGRMSAVVEGMSALVAKQAARRPERAKPEPERAPAVDAEKSTSIVDRMQALAARQKKPAPQVEAPGKAGPGSEPSESRPEDDDRGELDRAEAERERQEEEQRATREQTEREEAARQEQESEAAKLSFMDKIKARDEKMAQERERDDYDPWDR